MSEEQIDAANSTIWGYWLDQPGGTWVTLPRLPLTRAGYTKPPFTVTRPDGKVLNVVERDKDKSG